MKAAVALVAGVVFALGLGTGGMTQPARVLGFLDVFGVWNPALAFVMAGAVASYAVLRPLVMRRGRPVLAPAFALPARTDVDAALLAGAAMFGVGWGLVGYCPGPALVALGAAVPQAAIFVAAMTAGMVLFQWRRTRT